MHFPTTVSVTRRALMRAAVVFVAPQLVLAGCGGSSSTPEAVTIQGGEYAYVVPDEIEGGFVSMRLVNTGKEPHEFALGRIDGDHTLDETLEEMMANDGDVPWAHDVGGVPLLSPGKEVTLTRTLQPGRYALLCFFPSPAGKPHLELGMKREFEIGGESNAALPEPDAVITATPDGFVVPKLEAGTQTIELRNEAGKEPSWYLASAARPGGTAKDFEVWIEGGQKGAAPITFLGAMQSFPDGESVFVTLDLEAGTTYALGDDDGGLPQVQFTPR